MAADHSTMTRTEIETMFARRQQAYDNLDAMALAADYAEDAVIESPVSGRHGRAEAGKNIEAVFRAFLDIKMRTDRLIIDGDHVSQILTMEGTNIGGLFGLPPSGKSFKMPGVFVYELRDGQIVHEWRIYDLTGMLVRVGVLTARPAEPLA